MKKLIAFSLLVLAIITLLGCRGNQEAPVRLRVIETTQSTVTIEIEVINPNHNIDFLGVSVFTQRDGLIDAFPTSFRTEVLIRHLPVNTELRIQIDFFGEDASLLGTLEVLTRTTEILVTNLTMDNFQDFLDVQIEFWEAWSEVTISIWPLANMNFEDVAITLSYLNTGNQPVTRRIWVDSWGQHWSWFHALSEPTIIAIEGTVTPW